MSRIKCAVRYVRYSADASQRLSSARPADGLRRCGPSRPPFKSPHGDFRHLFDQRYLIKRQVRSNVAPDESQLFPRRMTRFFITTHRKR